MAKETIYRYGIDLQDGASFKWDQWVENVRAGNKEINSALDQSGRAFDEHAKHVSRTTQFYKEQRAENRLQSFYFRESRDALNALSFGFLAFMGTQDKTDEKSKQLNKTLLESFGVFQGLDFVLQGLGAGPWGVAVAGVAGLATAMYGLSQDTKTAADQIKLQHLEVDKMLSRLEEWEKLHPDKSTPMAVNQEDAKRELELVNSQIVALDKLIRNMEGARDGNVKNQQALQELNKSEGSNFVIKTNIVAKTKEQIDYIKQYNVQTELSGEKTNAAANIIAAATGKTIEEVKKMYAELFAKRAALQAALNETAATNTPSSAFFGLRFKAGIDDALVSWRAFTAEFSKSLPGASKGGPGEDEVKFHLETLKALKAAEFSLFTDEKAKELAIVTEWENSVVSSAYATEDEITRAKEIGAQRRKQIETKYARESFAMYAQFAGQAIGLIAQANANRYSEQLDDINAARDAELRRIDQALSAENLSDEQKKALQAEREAVEDRYNAKSAAVKRQQWEADKEARLAMAVIEGAVAVIKALPNLLLAGVTAAMVAAQIGIIASQKAPRFHSGGSAFMDAPSTTEIPIIVRGQETVRVTTPEQERQTGGSTIVINFNSPVPSGKWVIDSVKRAMRETGLSANRLIVNNRQKIIVSN